MIFALGIQWALSNALLLQLQGYRVISICIWSPFSPSLSATISGLKLLSSSLRNTLGNRNSLTVLGTALFTSHLCLFFWFLLLRVNPLTCVVSSFIDLDNILLLISFLSHVFKPSLCAAFASEDLSFSYIKINFKKLLIEHLPNPRHYHIFQAYSGEFEAYRIFSNHIFFICTLNTTTVFHISHRSIMTD